MVPAVEASSMKKTWIHEIYPGVRSREKATYPGILPDTTAGFVKRYKICIIVL